MITYRAVLATTCPACGSGYPDACGPHGELHEARRSAALRLRGIVGRIEEEVNAAAQVRAARRAITEATADLGFVDWATATNLTIPGRGDRSQHPRFVRLRVGRPEAH